MLLEPLLKSLEKKSNSLNLAISFLWRLSISIDVMQAFFNLGNKNVYEIDTDTDKERIKLFRNGIREPHLELITLG